MEQVRSAFRVAHGDDGVARRSRVTALTQPTVSIMALARTQGAHDVGGVGIAAPSGMGVGRDHAHAEPLFDDRPHALERERGEQTGEQPRGEEDGRVLEPLDLGRRHLEVDLVEPVIAQESTDETLAHRSGRDLHG